MYKDQMTHNSDSLIITFISGRFWPKNMIRMVVLRYIIPTTWYSKTLPNICPTIYTHTQGISIIFKK